MTFSLRPIIRTSFRVFGLIFLLSACAVSPTGRKQLLLVSAEEMEQMGHQGFAEIKKSMPVEKDPAINRYVNCVANELINVLNEKRNWEIVVFKEASANAFAVPGGHIGVHTGLLKVAKTQGQLAAVMGHEIGHVLAEHSRARVSEQQAAALGQQVIGNILGGKDGAPSPAIMGALGLGLQFGVLMPHGRAQESESDTIGLDLMARAGFDPRESVNLWQNMASAGGGSPPEFMSTHPSHSTRINDLKAGMNVAMAKYNAAPRRPNCK